VRESNTRRIIGSTAAALWVATALTAGIGVTVHWFLAIWLATAVASLGVLAILVDAMARARETQRSEAGRTSLHDSVQLLCAAIERHGDRLRNDVFNAEWSRITKWRGQTLAQFDAEAEAARRQGNDTGPLPIISTWPR
jgi:hypothetical protein